MKHVEKMLDKMPTSRRAVFVAVAIGLAALIGIIVWLIVAVQQNSNALAHSAAVNRARGQALGTANAKLTQNGIAPVTPKPEAATPGNTDLGPTTPSSTPSAERGRQGETGATGATGPGPTTAQVENAVTAYCADHSGCKGGPTQAQVAAAVVSYCKGDNCVGATGPSGSPGAAITGPSGASGEPGKDATGVQGPQGPGPTADQVADAVNAYCANGACRGPKGDTGDTGPAGPAGKDATGAPGKDGKDAPKIDSGTCTGTTLTFHETDGSTFSVADACGTSTVTVTAPPTSPDPTSTAP